MGEWVYGCVGVEQPVLTAIHPYTHPSPPMPPNIGITANPARPAALDCAADLVQRLRARGVELHVEGPVAARVGAPPAAEEELGRSDLLVAVGGDGTLLAASRLAAPYGTPIL